MEQQCFQLQGTYFPCFLHVSKTQMHAEMSLLLTRFSNTLESYCQRLKKELHKVIQCFSVQLTQENLEL